MLRPHTEHEFGVARRVTQLLGELAGRWEARHNHHKLQVGGLGSHVADAMTRYVSNEDESAQAVQSLGE